ncbi:hypothetical protein ACIBH1_42130 [Nonomuraea sp. NPDC050663]|uniref:hypothetical protein n=1 Tax=Nonomuraea sp. NPDC050663 TaxID=3364370 RepID=UPI0037AE4BF8
MGEDSFQGLLDVNEIDLELLLNAQSPALIRAYEHLAAASNDITAGFQSAL